MTYAEKKAILDTAKAVDELTIRIDALTELTEMLLSRKAGRPSKEDAERMESLRLRSHG